MGRKKPLGPTPAAFSVATGRAHGLTRAQLRGPQVRAPFRGVRTLETPDGVGARARALSTVLPERAFFCGLTAAELLGAPLPRRGDERMQVAVPHPAHPPERAGVRGRRLRIRADEVAQVEGVLVTTPARTWCDLVAELDLADLVAVGDDFLHRRSTTTAALTRAVERAPRAGKATLVTALDLLDGRAESRPESLVRVALVLAGCGPIEANVDIVDGRGVFIGRADLVLRDAGIIIEYLGDYHRVERGRWRKDRVRCGRFRAEGWLVIELVADHLADLPAVVAEVRAASVRPSRLPAPDSAE